jgi:hypothetical protein
MIRRGKARPIGALTLVVLWLLNALPAQACGPFFPQAIFTHKLHPDLPLENYARGELGILRRTYARSYLVVAYRYLTGKNLDRREQAAVMNLWQERLNGTWPNSHQWIKDWQPARKQVIGVGAGPQIRDTFRDIKQRYWFANCLEDTFRSAIATLNERTRRLGIDSAAIREWVAGQDAVLSNCADKEMIPAPLPPNADPLRRADRAYQIAAANFYAAHFDMAETLFRQIAVDRASPWSEIAPYLAVRALVRKATLTVEDENTERTLLRRAATELSGIAQDPGLKTTHAAARRLSAVIRLRAEPMARLNELAGEILKKDSVETLKQDLSDYTWLLDRIQRPEKPTDLTDWILTYQAGDAAALAHALNKWQDTKSIHWLMAVLDKSRAGQPHVDEALAQAAMVSPKSPAYLTIAYHRTRLLEELGRIDEARKLIDQLLSEPQSRTSRSALNLLIARRLQLARNLDEFLKYAPRVPTLVATGEEGRQAFIEESEYAGRRFFDEDAADALSRAFSLQMLKDAGLKPVLPATLRRELLLVAWVRAVLLGEEQTALELVSSLEPIAPLLSADLGSYARAGSVNARKFAAAYLILRYPGLRPYVAAGVGRTTPLNRIDDFKDNWWCSLDVILGSKISLNNVSWTIPAQSAAGIRAYANVNAPRFLTTADRQATDQERAQLRRRAAAPNYLGDQVIAWARSHPTDPRVPEALHLTVKASRFGCGDQTTGKVSRTAFEMLHLRYPRSEWSKKTPYWYQ